MTFDDDYFDALRIDVIVNTSSVIIAAASGGGGGGRCGEITAVAIEPDVEIFHHQMFHPSRIRHICRTVVISKCI